MIKTYKPEIDKLLKDVITDLSYRSITPLFSLTDYVESNNGIKSNGFFDAECREFACAVGKPWQFWLRTFIHESCHFDQWKERCDAWQASDRFLPSEEDLVWDWLDFKVDVPYQDHYNGKTMRFVDWSKIVEVAKVTKELERDCEERTIKKILEYGIPISTEDYARGAWAYVLFYEYILECRQWYVIGKEPYNNEDLKALMPTKMDANPVLTDEMRAIYAKCVAPV